MAVVATADRSGVVRLYNCDYQAPDGMRHGGVCFWDDHDDVWKKANRQAVIAQLVEENKRRGPSVPGGPSGGEHLGLAVSRLRAEK